MNHNFIDNEALANISKLYDQIIDNFKEQRKKVWGQIGDLPTSALLAFLADFAGNDLRILDIGCGAGHDMLAFPTLFRCAGYQGAIISRGCDVSSKMVEYCREHGLDVVQGDFRVLKEELGSGGYDLVWANMSLIHLPLSELSAALSACVDFLNGSGLIAIGFKVGEDFECIDPADERIPIDRPTTFFSMQRIRNELENLSCAWTGYVEVPSKDSSYSYGWLFARKCI